MFNKIFKAMIVMIAVAVNLGFMRLFTYLAFLERQRPGVGGEIFLVAIVAAISYQIVKRIFVQIDESEWFEEI